MAELQYFKFKPFIGYTSPGPGHPILRRTGAKAYEAVVEFLTVCTDWNRRWQRGAIAIEPRGDFRPADWVARPVIEALDSELLGRAKSPEAAAERLEQQRAISESRSTVDWPVPSRKHDWAVKFSLAQVPAKKSWPDPVCYSAETEYRLRWPNASVLSGQLKSREHSLQIRSDMLLWVSARNTAATFGLRFPFDEPTPEFVEYVTAIRPYLPIRLSKVGFCIYMPAKNKHGWKTKRVDKSLFAHL